MLLAEFVLRRLGDVEGHEFHGNQFSAGSAPTTRPDGGQVVKTSVVGSIAERRGIKIGSQVSFHYRPIGQDIGRTGKGKVVGFVKNAQHIQKLGSVQDVVIRTKDAYVFVAEKNVRNSVRVLGGVEGHEFHGNQWTSSTVLGKGGTPLMLYHGSTAKGMTTSTANAKTLAAKETPLHAAADSFVKKIQTTMAYAFAMGRRAVKGVSPSKAPDVAAQAVSAALLEALPKTLAPVFTAGGQAGLAMLKKALRTAATVEDTPTSNTAAAAWAKKHVAELVKDISETTRQHIADAIARSLENDDDPYDAILDAVGDDARAEVIARTESMRAVHEGQRQEWEQAVEDGLLTGNERRVWIATEVGACPECEALDNERADLDGTYPGGVEGPPLHPNCRCTEGIGAL